ncbi:hypothetical protein PAXRUDRAFT_753507 [Paxillus rubicundulus Ve08.2h10]|uniref:G domain-containing protein n=1 Tax=Paxillus rubicundulus Ve08.2h10 TaxID=930991 RepID=A0A0D0E7Q4_9AGAM|nr:hypothetical protein PAXRUDRAFT_753507 [Paxillus rubicundulus Ve08.2h10]
MSQRSVSVRNGSGDTAIQEVMQMRNVVLFGESGVGKSSIINMMMGEEVAKCNNGAQGCTLTATQYTIPLDSRVCVQLWDTVGLDEGSAGTTIAVEAKRHLEQLLKDELDAPGGIDLLIYCIRADRVKRAHQEKYRFVYEKVCKKAVPVALVVTGLEIYAPEGDMDSWWSDHEKEIQRSQYDDGDDVRRFDISKERLLNLLKEEFRAVGVHSEFQIK